MDGKQIWLHVGDSLPGDWQTVLAALRGGTVIIAVHFREGDVSAWYAKEPHGDTYPISTVEYWMPIPETPKVKVAAG